MVTFVSMLANAEIMEIINARIATDEKLGEHAGGSGHLGYVSFNLDEHESKELADGNVEITYRYTISIETEFTYYPDNPPEQTRTHKRIVVDPDKQIIEEETLDSETSLPPMLDPDSWDQ